MIIEKGTAMKQCTIAAPIIAMAYDAKPTTVHADSVMKLTSADGIFRKLFQLLSWEKHFPISMR